ncbi:MAG TPA: rhodanese-like domain-containing protein [Noviherbaspirillum sp.]
MNLLHFTAHAAAALAISLGAMLPASAQRSASIYQVDVEQSRDMQKRGALLLDVREPHEFDEVHAPGSVLIPLSQLQERIVEIGDFKRNPIVIICRSGRRSMQAASVLGKLGFASLYNVQGGMLAWEQAALPVIRKRR